MNPRGASGPASIGTFVVLGGHVDSDVSLSGGAEPATTPSPTPVLRVRKATAAFDDPSVWLKRFIDASNGTDWLLMGAYPEGRGWLLRFPDLADFAIDADLAEVKWFAPRPVAPEILRYLLLDQVIPRVLSLRGEFVVHASGVADRGRAALLVGPSGAGKSTLAASLARAGYSVLGDDAVVVRWQEGIAHALGGAATLRLLPETARALSTGGALLDAGWGKVTVAASPTAEACPLERLFILSEGPEITVEPLVGRDAFDAVFGALYRVDQAPERLAADFDRASRLSDSGRVWRLRYPRRFGDLASVERRLRDAFDRVLLP